MNYTLLVDLDDTLIANSHTYFQPQLEMAGLICWDLGFNSPPPTTIINQATDLQVQRIKDQGCISKHNFPISYVDTYISMCETLKREPNEKIKSAIAMAGIKYFIENYQIFDGVEETLRKIKEKNEWKTIIVTRGEVSVQQYKIDITGLGKHFDYTEIVALKNKQTYLDLIRRYNLEPSKTVMVGDSLRNDIIPALEAGIHGIQVNDDEASDWEKSLGDISVSPELANQFYKIKDFTEITDYLDKIFISSPIGR